MRYSKMLEENTFHGHKADYVWMLMVSSALLLVSCFPDMMLSFPLDRRTNRILPDS
jgi:Derlin-2/3